MLGFINIFKRFLAGRLRVFMAPKSFIFLIHISAHSISYIILKSCSNSLISLFSCCKFTSFTDWKEWMKINKITKIKLEFIALKIITDFFDSLKHEALILNQFLINFYSLISLNIFILCHEIQSWICSYYCNSILFFFLLFCLGYKCNLTLKHEWVSNKLKQDYCWKNFKFKAQVKNKNVTRDKKKVNKFKFDW